MNDAASGQIGLSTDGLYQLVGRLLIENTAMREMLENISIPPPPEAVKPEGGTGR